MILVLILNLYIENDTLDIKTNRGLFINKVREVLTQIKRYNNGTDGKYLYILLTLVVCYKIGKGTLTDHIGVAAIYGALVGYALSALWGKNAGKEKENGNA